MRSSILLPGLILFAASFSAAQSPSPAAKETVKFDGETLPVASNESNDKESLREYIPGGENFDTWTKLASVHVYRLLNDPMATVAALQANLEKQYPGSHNRVIKNPKTGDVIIDFLIISPDSAFAEWNVMKYTKNPGGGLTMYQYGLRAYGDKMKDFLKGLVDERVRLVDLMAEKGLVISQ
jgi:hypothetical protein